MSQSDETARTTLNVTPFQLKGGGVNWSITWYDPYTGAERKLETIAPYETQHPSQEALAALREHVARVAPKAPPSRLGICDVIENYLRSEFRTAASFEYEARRLQEFCRFLADRNDTDSLDVSQANHSQLLSVIAEFVAVRQLTVSDGTIRANLTAIRNALRHAHDAGLISEMPNIAGPNGRPLPKKDDYLSYADVGSLLDAMARKAIRAPVLLFTMITLSTCAHQNAVIALTQRQTFDRRVVFERDRLRTTRMYNPSIAVCPTLKSWLHGTEPKIISREGRPIFSIWRAFDNCLAEIGLVRATQADVAGYRRQRGLGSPSILRRTIEAHLNEYGLPKALIRSVRGVKPSIGSTNKYIHIATDDSSIFIEAVEDFWRKIDDYTDVHRHPDIYRPR